MQPSVTVTATKWACVVGGVVSAAAALYGLMGVLQAVSLFSGERALGNVNLWSSLFLVGVFAAAVLFALAARVRLGLTARKVAGAVSAAVGVWALSAVVARELAIDQCLDRGGSFNYVQGACDHSANHPSLSLAATHGFVLTAGALACVAAAWFLGSAYATRRHVTSAL